MTGRAAGLASGVSCVERPADIVTQLDDREATQAHYLFRAASQDALADRERTRTAARG